MVDNNNMHFALVAGVAQGESLIEFSGAREASFAINRAVSRAERAIIGCAGQVLQQKQSTVWAVFERAETCLMAALEIQKRVSELPKLRGMPLQMRIGIHYGEMPQPPTAQSDPMKAAQQLALIAGEGRILASQTVLDLAPAHYAETARAVSAPGFSMPVFQIIPHENTKRDAQTQNHVILNIRIAQRRLQAGVSHPVVLLGRDLGNDLVLSDPQVSRQHARIEYRDNHFFLIDRSSNGTYIQPERKAEVFIKSAEFQITGKGAIGCGFSPDPENISTLYFELT